MKSENSSTHPGLSPEVARLLRSRATTAFGERGPPRRKRRHVHWIAALALVSCVSCFGTCTARAETNATAAAAVDALAPIRKPEYLFEVTRHLYRWYLDESDVDNVPQTGPVQFWIRRLTPKLDAGDESLFAEITIPLLRTVVKLKDTDYTIEELGVRVNSSSYKIINVERTEPAAEPPADWEVVSVEMKDLRDYLLRTRDQRDYPSKELSRRMGEAVADQYDDFPEAMKEPEQIVFWSPLSPVANEVWAYWQTAGKLIHFSSDIDLANPAVWEHDELSMNIFDADSQVLVSHNEAPGSNRFMTRDQIGRVLYNCIVLGEKRITPTKHLKQALEKAGKIPGGRGP